MKIQIDYIVDDENMTDKQYEDQEDKSVIINTEDIIDILTYGTFKKQLKLSDAQTIGEITNIKIVN